MGEKKYTTAKDDIGGATAMCTWNEHIFFEPRNVVINRDLFIEISFRKKTTLNRLG
jgi:hypothetical protein